MNQLESGTRSGGSLGANQESAPQHKGERTRETDASSNRNRRLKNPAKGNESCDKVGSRASAVRKTQKNSEVKSAAHGSRDSTDPPPAAEAVANGPSPPEPLRQNRLFSRRDYICKPSHRTDLLKVLAHDDHSELNHMKKLARDENASVSISSILADFAEFPVNDGEYTYHTTRVGYPYTCSIVISTESDGRFFWRRLFVADMRNENRPKVELFVNADSTTKELRFAVYRAVCQQISPALRWKDCITCRQPLYQRDLNFAESEYLLPLEKRDSRFPLACYYCRICRKHLNSFAAARYHCAKPFHKKAKAKVQKSTGAASFPIPSVAHYSAVTNLLRQYAQQYGRSDEELTECERLMSDVEGLFQEHVSSECHLRLTGSVLSKTALKVSDINADVVLPQVTDMNDLVERIDNFMSGIVSFEGVHIDYDTKYPRIEFTFQQYSIVLTLKFETNQDVYDLVRIYACRYRELRTLAIVVRKWARDCRVSGTGAGIPPRFFDLMLIHFLQQKYPQLIPIMDNITFESNNGRWHLSSQMYESVTDISDGWDIGLLWVQFLKFYAFEFRFSYDVVHVLSAKPLNCVDKGWMYERMAVEDPFSRNKSALRLQPSVINYFLHCVSGTYRYFGQPQTKCGCVPFQFESRQDDMEDTDRNSNSDMADADEFKLHAAKDKHSSDFEHGQDEAVRPDAFETNAVSGTTSSSDEDDCIVDYVNADMASLPNEQAPAEASSHTANPVRHGVEQTVVKAKHRCNFEEVENPHFEFKVENFAIALKPPTTCECCGSKRHPTLMCSQNSWRRPSVPPLPQMTPSYLCLLDTFFADMAIFLDLSRQRLRLQESFREELEYLLNCHLPEKICLHLFGSSLNGFGLESSDLDLCLTLSDSDTFPGKVKLQKFIHQVTRVLRESRKFANVSSVLRAKVPIVKFYHNRSRLQGDISFCNVLALRNTALLRMYSTIDGRAKALGFLVKTFAKFCDIGDASRGSLSSYAYIVMVIHYLQNTTPPILPVLQELPADPTQRRSVIVDGYETYFYDDLENLPRVWNVTAKNKSTLAELFIGFFRYYVEEFDLCKMVVQIHTKRAVQKLEHLRGGRALVIEDPFDHDRNLSSGCSKSMLAYIIRRFAQARFVFGSPEHEQVILSRFPPPIVFNQLLSYFFNTCLQCTEPCPKDNVCRRCGHIGHIAEECQILSSQQILNEFYSSSDDEHGNLFDSAHCNDFVSSSFEETFAELSVESNGSSCESRHDVRHEHD